MEYFQGCKELEQIFDQMSASLLGYLKTMLLDEHLAEDVLQNVFIKIFKAVMSDYKIKNLKAFIFTVARNEANRERHKNKKISYISLAGQVFIYNSNKIKDQELSNLQEALLSLPVKQREVVYLKIYAGFSYPEIGQCMDISENTAASRFRYAMEKMRSFLED